MPGGFRGQETQLSLKFVKADLAWRYAEFCQHLTTGFNHHRGSAKVIFDCFWVLVMMEIIIEHHFVNKAGQPGPPVFRQGRRKRQVETEGGVHFRQGKKIVIIENFLLRTGTVPETYLASGFLRLEKMGKMSPERRHTG